MNNKIKIISLTLMLLTSVGCGKDNSSTNNISSPTASTSSPISSTLIDTNSYECSTYSNPVSIVDQDKNAYTNGVADPTVVRGEDGYLYCVGTSRIMLRSEDGCNWEVVSNNIIEYPRWGSQYSSSSYGVWAPDLVKVKDKWIYYYSLSGWGSPIGIGYAVADNISGPYTDKGKLFTGEEMGVLNCIDAQVIVDDDNKVYMTVGSFQGNWLIELTEDGMECLNGIEYQKENKTLIAGKVSQWDGSQYEGGYIIKKGEWYYYFGSSGNCCEGKDSTYLVRVGKSKSIKGPYIDSNKKMLTMSGAGANHGNLVVWAGTNNPDYVGPGHNSIYVDEAGDYWIYYHAYSSTDNWVTRHLFMDKLEWDENGFPYVEDYKSSFQEEKNGPKFIIEG